MTQRATYRFVVKEFAAGEPWLTWEPWEGEIRQLRGCVCGFDLPPGTTLEHAQKVADFLNVNIVGLAVTDN